MSLSRLSVSAASFSAAFAVAATALATGNFPGAIEADLNLDYQPPCSLCHEGGKTGGGTVNTPFGKAMRARGLVADDEGSLATALGKMMDDAVDSDGDGTTDIDELVADTDPNQAGGGSLGENSPQYGCGAQIAPGNAASGSPAALALAFLTAVGLAVQLRPRRPRRRQRPLAPGQPPSARGATARRRAASCQAPLFPPPRSGHRSVAIRMSGHILAT